MKLILTSDWLYTKLLLGRVIPAAKTFKRYHRADTRSASRFTGGIIDVQTLCSRLDSKERTRQRHYLGYGVVLAKC